MWRQSSNSGLNSGQGASGYKIPPNLPLSKGGIRTSAIMSVGELVRLHSSAIGSPGHTPLS